MPGRGVADATPVDTPEPGPLPEPHLGAGTPCPASRRIVPPPAEGRATGATAAAGRVARRAPRHLCWRGGGEGGGGAKDQAGGREGEDARTGRAPPCARWRAVLRRAARLARQPRDRWLVYVARCGDGTLYTGITNDLERRRAQHESGGGARYTRGRGRIQIVHVEPAESKGAALSREHAIKRLPRDEKLRLARR